MIGFKKIKKTFNLYTTVPERDKSLVIFPKIYLIKTDQLIYN